jgi:ubiquinone/menaquinone biosynthesis C-methylase UbiE
MQRAYLPAAGRDIFLPLYDPFTKLFGFDGVRRALLEQAALRPHFRVLDVGCGTGTLTVLIRRLYPAVDVVGLDPDPRALARARRKAQGTGVPVRFDRGFSDALGYPDASFDRVFSSMMFHHLDEGDKEPTLREIRRVLKPGGRLELLDFEGPDAHAHGLVSRLIHAHARLRGNASARVLDLMVWAGFRAPVKVAERETLFGRLAFYQASTDS